MKKFLLLCITGLFLHACNDQATGTADADAAKDSAKTAMPAISYPYTATYSSSFAMGDPQHAKMILELWKHWDNNTLDESAGSFADTVTMQFSDGTVIRASRDSVTAVAKSVRGQYTSVASTVDVFIPLKSTDKDASWVCVWGKEVRVDKKGKVDSTQLQENWMINKDGKVALLVQYESKPWK